MAGCAERVIVSKDNNSVKMSKSKFPGKPSKSSSKRRVNLRNTTRPEHNENSRNAESICKGRQALQGFIPEFTQDFHGFSPSDLKESIQSRIRIPQRPTAEVPQVMVDDRNVFDGGGPPRKRLLLTKSLESQVAKRLLDRAKTSKPKAENEFKLPPRSRSSRVIKPNKRFLSESEGAASSPAGRVILREARLQIGVPAPTPPTRGPFSSVTCGVCGGFRDGTGTVPGAKSGLRSCDQCRKMASRVVRLGKKVRCQGKVPATCTGLECHFCWVHKCLTLLSIPGSLRAKLTDLLPESNLSFFTSFNNSHTPPKQAKDASKKPSPERQRHSLAGPRVKHVCRSASVALGQPIATFPPVAAATDETPAVAEPVQPTPETLPSKELIQPEPDPVIPNTVDPPEPVKDPLPPPPPPPPPSLTVDIKPQRRKKSQVEETEDLISMDFWENYDPEEVCETGFSLTGSDVFCVRALCYLCGSAGLEHMIMCACCCEPYHPFCLGVPDPPQTAWDWVCPRCRTCASCGKASGQQLTCVRCDNSYHTECAGGRLHHAPDRPWVCWLCLRCKSCNGDDVSVFVGNLPLCKPCFVLRQKGNFCPLCQKCYDDDDYDCKMMECGGCGSWVHAKCEGLSDESYQVLSFLPESVEFVCRMCCVMPPAPWWVAVEAELKAGYLGVLKALSKNRNACRVLKWSPRKLTDCACRRKSLDDPETNVGDTTDDDLKECLCFLEDDRYTSRSKPFSADLLTIKQKVLDHEYSSLAQFNEDMTAMMDTAQLIESYYTALKEVFPWFEPRAGRVLDASRSGSLENTPIKSSPVKVPSPAALPCLVPEEVSGPQYVGGDVADDRVCLLCKGVGDAASDGTGRMLYCGNNEWVHCNCALWSSEVYEEIDGSLQNVHVAVSRGRSLKCPECGLRGASVGCCAKGCAETLHFVCARRAGAAFLQDKTVYCRSHVAEAAGRPLEGDRGFEIRRPVYVELDKRRNKPVPASHVKVTLGSLKIQQLGQFVPNLSDLKETIMPAGFVCERWFWSTKKPWDIIRYKLQVRLQEPEHSTGLDLGINLTVDHAHPDLEPTMQTMAYFHTHLALPPELILPHRKRKRRAPELLEESENQHLLPPDLEEAILKELSHDILEGISVQDIFQDMSEQEREGDDDATSRKTVPATLRSGNRNLTGATALKWKKKPQEGKENKMISWCDKLIQVDGAVDSSSGSEAGESPARCTEPAAIPQLDGMEDSDYESEDAEHQDGGTRPAVVTEEAPVKCSKCKCTYRTQKSYEKHLETRCHELLSSSEDDEPVADATPPSSKPKVYTRKKPPVAVAPAPPMPLILHEIPPQQSFQPMMQYTMMPTVPSVPYQLVLPQAPMIIAQPPAPVFEVLSDPATGGVYLAPPAPTQAPPPVIYNMETIVSNTVHMHAVHHTSYSHTQSTQLMQTTKQVVNMPTGFVLSPNDLICVPVNQTRPQPQPTLQWTQVQQQVKPAPKPKPKTPVKQRSRALVDFINNFTIDDETTHSAQKSGNVKGAQARISQLGSKFTKAAQSSSNQPIFTMATNPTTAAGQTVATFTTANQPIVTLSLTTQPITPKQTYSASTAPPINTVPSRPATNQLKAAQPFVMANQPVINQFNAIANQTPPFIVSTQPSSTQSFIIGQSSPVQPITSLPPTNPVANRVETAKVKPISVVTAVVRPVRSNLPSMSMPSLEVNCEESYSMPSLSSPQSPMWKKDCSPQLQVSRTAPMRTYSTAKPLQSPPIASTVHLPSSLVRPFHPSLSPKNITSPHLSPHPYSPQSFSPAHSSPQSIHLQPQPVTTSHNLPQSNHSHPPFPINQNLPQSGTVPPVKAPQTFTPPHMSPHSFTSPQSFTLSHHSPQANSPQSLHVPRQSPQSFTTPHSSPHPNISSPTFNQNMSSPLHSPHSLKICSPQMSPNSLPSNSPRRNPHSSPLHCSVDSGFRNSPQHPSPLQPSVESRISSLSQPVYSQSRIENTSFATQHSPKMYQDSLLANSPNLSLGDSFKASQFPSPKPTYQSCPSSTIAAPKITMALSPTYQNPVPISPSPLSNTSKSVSSNYYGTSQCNPSVLGKTGSNLPLLTVTVSLPSSSLAHPPPPIPPPKVKPKVLSPISSQPSVHFDSPTKNNQATSPLTLAPPRIPNRSSDPPMPPKEDTAPLKQQQPLLMYDVVADDGFSFSSSSLADVWKKICDSVQNVRATYNMAQPSMAPRSFEIVGVGNHGVQHLLEQLPGAGLCTKYKARYFKQPRSLLDEELLTPPIECSTGCARSEGFKQRKDPDHFGWLASRHRKLPKVAGERSESETASRKSQNLPMAMRYRQLREAPRSELFVYRSKIHGMGLFCTREIEPGQMVIEYAGELIRASLTDSRERRYTEKGIGCYMFRIDDHYVVDATMKGNPARFINHSCEPNCYSKVVDILGRKHIIIFALRRIPVMEELTYDYKFPFEDVKISCHCQSRKCRKYLN